MPRKSYEYYVLLFSKLVAVAVCADHRSVLARRLPDWDCPQCGQTNIFGSKPECFRCHAANPARRFGSSPVAPPPAPVPTGRRPRLPDWDCETCQRMVFGSKDACNKCGARNPGLLPPTPAAPPPPPAGARRPDWECPNCPNFLVFGSKQTCPQCRARAPASVTDVGVPKGTAPPGGREGDWQCPSCPNFFVFGSKLTCPKCAARNPALLAHSAQPGSIPEDLSPPVVRGVPSTEAALDAVDADLPDGVYDEGADQWWPWVQEYLRTTPQQERGNAIASAMVLAAPTMTEEQHSGIMTSLLRRGRLVRVPVPGGAGATAWAIPQGSEGASHELAASGGGPTKRHRTESQPPPAALGVNPAVLGPEVAYTPAGLLSVLAPFAPAATRTATVDVEWARAGATDATRRALSWDAAAKGGWVTFSDVDGARMVELSRKALDF